MDVYEELIAAIHAGMGAARAELARTEQSLAITRVALALREAMLLDAELQLAQVMNYQRALDIAKRANLDSAPSRMETSVVAEMSSKDPI
jgi:outer membrane protein TolC